MHQWIWKRRRAGWDPVVLWRSQSAAEVIRTGRQQQRCEKEMRDGGEGERRTRETTSPPPGAGDLPGEPLSSPCPSLSPFLPCFFLYCLPKRRRRGHAGARRATMDGHSKRAATVGKFLRRRTTPHPPDPDAKCLAAPGSAPSALPHPGVAGLFQSVLTEKENR